MLQELVLFASVAVALSTLLVVVPAVVRSPLPIGVILSALSLAAAGWLIGVVAGDPVASVLLPVLALLLVLAVRLLVLRNWSLPAVQLFTVLVTGTLLYLVYIAVLTGVQANGPVVWIGSLLLLALELAALSLSVSYAFELLDVLGRRDPPERRADPSHRPPVAIQVPCYNEPVEVVERTLRSLAELRYPKLLVQVVDNNTPDEEVWRPLQELCEKLGPRFEFIHLEDWPGFKAGALNEATRRLAGEYELISIVDADYVVKPDFLERMAGYFADPRVAFVQSPQNYMDWEDDGYLRSLFYSYRYFFDVSMPSRAHRDAIIFAGTMGLIRRSALEEVGGWNQDCVTEDSEMSLRLLGRGYSGVYEPHAYGSGLMPLSFDGLKKQRFRWALGGIQILRLHWRELLPFVKHRLKLTRAQRIHYLLGCAQWFGELLTLAFTAMLVLTAAFLAFHHRLPVRQLVGAVVIVPMMFLFTGLLRAFWGLRRATGCGWRDALGALGVWFALSWVVTLACVRGLVRPKAAFLRTPKVEEGQSSIRVALATSKVETGLAGLSLLGAIVIPISALSPATAVLALLLLYQAFFYASAPWASLASAGVKLTDFRRAYLRSSQNTGDRPPGAIGRVAEASAWAVVGAGFAALVLLFATAKPAPPVQPDLPKFGQVAGASAKRQPAPPPTAAPAASPSSNTVPSPSSNTVPSPSSTPAGSPTP
jgi:cellulose synthase/poly-beta-1,6-N-acetylglucosamine synthase-like glycosyltransferase